MSKSNCEANYGYGFIEYHDTEDGKKKVVSFRYHLEMCKLKNLNLDEEDDIPVRFDIAKFPSCSVHDQTSFEAFNVVLKRPKCGIFHSHSCSSYGGSEFLKI